MSDTSKPMRTDNQRELKPCPFCGGEAHDRQMVDFGGGMCSLIACKDCGATSPVKRENSVKAWNTRASALAVEAPRDELHAVADGSVDSFVYDPATGFVHSDDGGAPEHGIKWVRVALQPSATQPDNNHMTGLRILEQAVVQKEQGSSPADKTLLKRIEEGAEKFDAWSEEKKSVALRAANSPASYEPSRVYIDPEKDRMTTPPADKDAERGRVMHIVWNETKTIGIVVNLEDPVDERQLAYELRRGTSNTLGLIDPELMEAWGNSTASENCEVESSAVSSDDAGR